MTAKTVVSNRPGIVIIGRQRTVMVIDGAIPNDGNIRKKNMRNWRYTEGSGKN